MAWEQIDPRATPSRLPAEPYARIGNGIIAIHNTYLAPFDLGPGVACEVFISRDPRRIGLRPAPAGALGTAVLHKQSVSNVSILASVRTLREVGLGRYASGTYPLVREGDLAVICIDRPEPRGEDDGGR